MSETNQSNPQAPEKPIEAIPQQPYTTPTTTQKPIGVVRHLNNIRTSSHLPLLRDFVLRKSISNYFRMKSRIFRRHPLGTEIKKLQFLDFFCVPIKSNFRARSMRNSSWTISLKASLRIEDDPANLDELDFWLLVSFGLSGGRGIVSSRNSSSGSLRSSVVRMCLPGTTALPPRHLW
nr:hypothetical protein [Tanacetum cinerariifolium]